MKKFLILIFLVILVATCANAQTIPIESQLTALIGQGEKVVVHNPNRSDLCKGVTHTTADRGGKAWIFDIYPSKYANQFERVLIVKSDQWYISREILTLNQDENVGFGEAPIQITCKKFDIDRVINALMRYVGPDLPKNLVAVKREGSDCLRYYS